MDDLAYIAQSSYNQLSIQDKSKYKPNYRVNGDLDGYSLIEPSKTPSHYEMEIQPVEFIRKNKLGFCEGNAIKYICRHDKKGTSKEDLKKAIHYLEMLLED